jgi:hypothetical protein
MTAGAYWQALQAMTNVWCQNIGKNIGLAETMFFLDTKSPGLVILQDGRLKTSAPAIFN